MSTTKRMMMMMMNKRSSLFIILLLVALNALSQEKDFGIWYGASAQFMVINKLEADINARFRTFNNASKLEEAFLEAELSYKFNNYLTAAASYRITENIEDDNAYHIRHKWFVDVKGTLPLGNLEISGRAMFQQRYKTYIEDENDKLPASHARFRFKTLYNFSTLPVDPYVFSEIFCPLFKDTDRVIDKKRIGAGIELDITAHHAVEVGYIFQRDHFPDLFDMNILSLVYTFKF